VHAALEWLHSREAAVACTSADLVGVEGAGTEGALPEVAQAVGAGAEEWREVATYLQHHGDICPLREPTDWVRPEPTIVAFDNEADVVVTARPDLVTGVGTEVVWRETKTLAVAPSEDDWLLLEQFPQASLGLVLVASGVVANESNLASEVAGLGDTDVVVPGRVELELLSPHGGRLVSYSTTDARVLMRARVLLSNRVDPWLRDTAFEAQPGQQCAWCPVQQWCRPDLSSNAAREAVAMIVDGFRVDPETGEILPVEGAGASAADPMSVPMPAPMPTARVRSLAESIVGQVSDVGEDDLPF
jgi:hypothetical protein